MSPASPTGPILIELDEQTRSEQLDRAEEWSKNVRMVQATFRQLAEDTLEEVHEPPIRENLTHIIQKAEEHEKEADRLFELIGRDPPLTRELMGEAMGKARQGQLEELVLDFASIAILYDIIEI